MQEHWAGINWDEDGGGERLTGFFADCVTRAHEAADRRDAPQLDYDGFYTVYETSRDRDNG